MSFPARTCIGCRGVAPARELVRLVASGDGVTVAAPGASGRGAWLHPRTECVAAAVKGRAFSRAFKRGVTAPETTALVAALEAAIHRTR